MKKLLLLMISIYKRTFSLIFVALLGNGCRFYPTCSEYARDAINKHGIFRGTKLATIRLSKCHPLNRSSYFDPVPEN